jgi:excisionase family DNA binding protein
VSDESPPSLLTVEEVAAFLRTTKDAIYHKVERGQLPGVVRMGKRLLFRRVDVRKHVGLAQS